MKSKNIHFGLVVLGGVLLLGNGLKSEETGSSRSKPAADCWKNGPAYYRDYNHDGRIDWEVSGENWRADGSDIYKVDMNFDGYYDLKYSFGYGITGRPTTNGLEIIHERVPAIGKNFVPISKPNWME